MYHLIEYSSNHSETTESLWFHSKNEATDFNADIDKSYKSDNFNFKAKLLGNTVAQPNPNHANGILKNSAIAVPLKFLINFWRSLEIPLINCEIELKLKWTKYCVFSSGGTENDVNENDNAINIIFTIRDTKLYFSIVTLSARGNQKLSKLPKGVERSVLLE